MVQGCRELVSAFLQAQHKLPEWTEKQHKAEGERGLLIHRKQELQDQSRGRCEKLQDSLAVLNNELQKARKKEKEYEHHNIQNLIERSAKQEELAGRKDSLQKQQNTLTSQYEETSTKYERLINGLNEEWNKIHGAKLRQKEELNDSFSHRLEEISRQREAATEALFREYELLSEQLHPEKSEKQNVLTELHFRMEACRKEVFFEAEQEELKHRIQSYTGLHMSKISRKNNAELAIKEINLKWEDERQKAEREIEEKLLNLQNEQQQLRPRLEELEAFLRSSKHTLQGWLKDNKEGWEETIGKLCDESVLWQTNLSPQLIDDGKSFYGISIDLAHVHRPIKSINDYQKRKKTEKHVLLRLLPEYSNCNWKRKRQSRY